MKVRLDLQKPIKLMDGTSPRYVTGELVTTDGVEVLVLDEMQDICGRGRKIARGTFIHLASRTCGLRLDLAPVEEPKAGAVKLAKAVKGATA